MFDILKLKMRGLLRTFREDVTLKEMVKKDSGLAFLARIMSQREKLKDNSSWFMASNQCCGCCFWCDQEDCSSIMKNRFCEACIIDDCTQKEGGCTEEKCESCTKNCVYSSKFEIEYLTKNC